MAIILELIFLQLKFRNSKHSNQQKTNERQVRRVETAKVISLIKTSSTRGDGTSANPSRAITQYWSLDGKLLFEEDPVKQGQLSQHPA